MNKRHSRLALAFLVSGLCLVCLGLGPTAQAGSALSTDTSLDSAGKLAAPDAPGIGTNATVDADPTTKMVGKAKNNGKSKGKGKGKKSKSKKSKGKKSSKKKGKPNKKSNPPVGRDKDDGDEDPPRGPASNNPLGLAYGEHYGGDEFRSYLDQLNVKRYKIALYWHQIEPVDDQYDWGLIDSYLDQVQEGDEPLVCIFTASTWGTDGFCKGRPPLDYDDYHDFIYDLVLHCEGKVKYWQRDSEPFTCEKHWLSDHWMEYLETQREFYEAVKEADPDAVVVGVGHAGKWIDGEPGNKQCYEIFLQYGKDWFDACDIRLYKDLYTIPERVGWFRDKMSEYGYSKPIFSAEYGGPHPCQFPSGWDELAAKMQRWGQQRSWEEQNDPQAWWKYIHSARDTFEEPSIRMFLYDAPQDMEDKHDRILARDVVQRAFLALGSGAEKIWYWSLHMPWSNLTGPHPYFGKQRLTDLRSELIEPAFEIYARMAAKLDGFASIEKIDTGDPAIFLYRVDKTEGEPLFVLWQQRDAYEGENEPDESFTWSFPWSSITATDVYGNLTSHQPTGFEFTLSINDTPRYIEQL